MNQTSLLSGNIRQQILTLAVPLLLGNILQQLYNTADSLIVGRFLGTNAFASVGISGSLMNLFIFILDGFCAGITIVFHSCKCILHRLRSSSRHDHRPSHRRCVHNLP